MDRRAVLAAVATAIAGSGCLDRAGSSGGDDALEGDGPTVAGSFDGGPSRPECEVTPETVEVTVGDEVREHETAGTVPYPDPPGSFEETPVVEFADAFEEAYVTHDTLCDRPSGDHVLEVGYASRVRETFDRRGDVHVVFLLRSGGALSGVDDGGMWAAELGYQGVVYAVDRTGVARATYDEAARLDPDEYEEHAPDPLESGEFVAVFG